MPYELSEGDRQQSLPVQVHQQKKVSTKKKEEKEKKGRKEGEREEERRKRRRQEESIQSRGQKSKPVSSRKKQKCRIIDTTSNVVH